MRMRSRSERVGPGKKDKEAAVKMGNYDDNALDGEGDFGADVAGSWLWVLLFVLGCGI